MQRSITCRLLGAAVHDDTHWASTVDAVAAEHISSGGIEFVNLFVRIPVRKKQEGWNQGHPKRM